MKIGAYTNNTNNVYYEENNKKIEKTLAKIAAQKPILEDGASKILYDQLISQLNGINQGTQNLNDASGYLKIADGALSNVSQTLSDVKADLVRLNNGILNDSQKNAIKADITSKLSSIGDSINRSTYGGKNIFSSGTLSFNDGKSSIDISVGQIKTEALKGDIETAGATNPYANFESRLDNFTSQVQQSQASIAAGLNYVESGIKSNLTQAITLANAASNFDTPIEESLTELKNALNKKEAQITFLNAHKKALLEKSVAKLFA